MITRFAAAFLVGLLLSAVETAVAETSSPTHPDHILFCETKAPFESAGCALTPVRLPHNWTPRARGVSFGLYRIEIPRPSPGAYAILLERLALDGAVRIERLTVFDELAAEPIRKLRYWPVLGQFQITEAKADTLVIDIAVRAHSEIKNGLGGLTIGPP